MNTRKAKMDLVKTTCPHCDQPYCNYSCDFSVAHFTDDQSPPLETDQQVLSRLINNAKIDAVETFVASMQKNYSLYFINANPNLLKEAKIASIKSEIESRENAIEQLNKDIEEKRNEISNLWNELKKWS